MIRIIEARRHQGHKTTPFPYGNPGLPGRFRGLPVIQPGKVTQGCSACVEACPTGALTMEAGALSLDLGKCIFCGDCARACRSGAVTLSNGFRLSSRSREGLTLKDSEVPRVEALDRKARRLFGRSLRLRQVSAGGCNGCEVELAALQNVVFDFQRFGIQFVASPRHADGLLVTGPVTRNMELALRKTYAAVPEPKIVIAAGACAISGGPFALNPEVMGGAAAVVPVDLYIAGCPPHPITLLDGLLRLLGRIEGGDARGEGPAPPSP
jgi:Ni,Fe-hydrogenase III small subunit/formate hydrogenlyase subunit 6/NADH:ubiquinone oxidoreductase subunit I